MRYNQFDGSYEAYATIGVFYLITDTSKWKFLLIQVLIYVHKRVPYVRVILPPQVLKICVPVRVPTVLASKRVVQNQVNI